MYSAGLKGPTGGGKTDLIGNLSLVGVKGNFCAVLSERQLTLERIDGKGLRINLGSINRTRALKISYLPNGLVPLGLISVGLGITAMTLPYGLIPIILGILAILFHVYSRYSILAIETFSGDRHLISGSEGTLLRLTIMISRLGQGNDIEQARIGLENLDNEVPSYPAFTHAGGSMVKSSKGLISQKNLEEEIIQSNDMKDIFPAFNGIDNNKFENTNANFEDDSKSAYEGAWGGRSPPSWYNEKESKNDDINDDISRIDSVLSEAADQLDMFGGNIDMFGQGGLFDSNPDDSQQVTTQNESDDRLNYLQNDLNSSISSAQMIKKAYDSHGIPDGIYEPKHVLPGPNEIAVRDECKSGIVNQTKAIQENNSRRNELNYTPKTSNLSEFPALKNLAYNRGESRINFKGKNYENKNIGWLDKLLRPASSRTQLNRNNAPTIGLPLLNKNIKFQTSQHLRLRSDQEHQSDVGVRIRKSQRINSNNSSQNAINKILLKISDKNHSEENIQSIGNNHLKFNQLRSTISKSNDNLLPGIKKLL
ncbi:MAG: hypothetical protein ACI9O1_000458 [Candidatus Thalassarchaeaceae archaeon]|jgi:hypothetical protein